MIIFWRKIRRRLSHCLYQYEVFRDKHRANSTVGRRSKNTNTEFMEHATEQRRFFAEKPVILEDLRSAKRRLDDGNLFTFRCQPWEYIKLIILHERRARLTDYRTRKNNSASF